MPFSLRPIREDEYPLLPKMERAADQRLIDAGYFTEDDIGPGDFTLERYLEPGHACMAVDEGDAPIGFVYWRDDPAKYPQGPHVEELSVLPEHGRQGVGAALMRHVMDVAARDGAFAVTLSTDRFVPWQTPFYEKLGFESVSPMALGQEYVAIRAAEAVQGLDPTTRHLMIYYLNPISRNEAG